MQHACRGSTQSLECTEIVFIWSSLESPVRVGLRMWVLRRDDVTCGRRAAVTRKTATAPRKPRHVKAASVTESPMTRESGCSASFVTEMLRFLRVLALLAALRWPMPSAAKQNRPDELKEIKTLCPGGNSWLSRRCVAPQLVGEGLRAFEDTCIYTVTRRVFKKEGPAPDAPPATDTTDAKKPRELRVATHRGQCPEDHFCIDVEDYWARQRALCVKGEWSPTAPMPVHHFDPPDDEWFDEAVGDIARILHLALTPRNIISSTKVFQRVVPNAVEYASVFGKAHLTQKRKTEGSSRPDDPADRGKRPKSMEDEPEMHLEVRRHGDETPLCTSTSADLICEPSTSTGLRAGDMITIDATFDTAIAEYFDSFAFDAWFVDTAGWPDLPDMDKP